jgi:hypothetical protein
MEWNDDELDISKIKIKNKIVKTYFNKLNEQSEIFTVTDRDIDKLISDSKLKEIVMGFPIYINNRI